MGNEAIRQGWNKAAEGYRNHLGHQLERIGEHLERILPREIPGPVLDLACGPGTVLFQLSRTRGGIQGVGCDFSLEMGKLARARNQGAQAVVADQDRLPFRREIFGGIVSSMGTIFSSNHDLQLREIGSILKQGGVFAFSAWGKREDCGLRRVSESVTMAWPHGSPEAVPPLDSPFAAGESEWLTTVAGESGLVLKRAVSDELVFSFDSVFEAAKSLFHTGRFALLLSNHPEREEELFQLTMEHFRPFQELSGKVSLSNRYHLFLFNKSEAVA